MLNTKKKSNSNSTDYISLVTSSINHELNNHFAISSLVISDIKQAVSAASVSENNGQISQDLQSEIIRRCSLLEETNQSARTFVEMTAAKLNPESIKQEDLSILNAKTEIELLLEKNSTKKRGGGRIKVDLPNNLYFLGCPVMLKHIVLNLLENAFHAIQEKGEGEILVYDDSDDNQVILCVKDTGMGIEQETLKHIFQFGYTTKGEKGSGTGLALCKRLADQMGAIISCDSKFGEYTCFKLILSRVREH